ncbi:MAG: hypothetical protein K0R47_4024 [Brevibacillus sp.]|nr:hypothetical protein [Brevibacillus sp.]
MRMGRLVTIVWAMGMSAAVIAAAADIRSKTIFFEPSVL